MAQGILAIAFVGGWSVFALASDGVCFSLGSPLGITRIFGSQPLPVTWSLAIQQFLEPLRIVSLLGAVTLAGFSFPSFWICPVV
jgi:hypothetical protein